MKVFNEIIGDTPESRILDFLLLNPHQSYSLATIMRATKLNFRTTRKRMDVLVGLEIVKIGYSDGKSNYFQINIPHLVEELTNISDNWHTEI